MKWNQGLYLSVKIEVTAVSSYCFILILTRRWHNLSDKSNVLLQLNLKYQNKLAFRHVLHANFAVFKELMRNCQYNSINYFIKRENHKTHSVLNTTLNLVFYVYTHPKCVPLILYTAAFTSWIYTFVAALLSTNWWRYSPPLS